MVTELVRSGAVVDICDNQSKTALHWAVAAGNIELAGHLLDLGADVNRPFSSGETAAHLAAFLEQHDTLGEWSTAFVSTCFLQANRNPETRNHALLF